MEIPTFTQKKDLFKWLVENKDVLIAQKKAAIKYADGFSYLNTFINDKGETVKSNKPVKEDVDTLKVRAIINTTNIMDSHKDVHLPGIWNKSLKENKNIMHLQEHELKFSSIIADGDDLKAYVKDYTWKELGFKWEGKTEGLTFDSNISKDRNSFMFNQYKSGRVKNHSVGMIYVKMLLAVNDESFGAEYETWEKYYPEIINKEFADEAGYFWAIKEAKVLEGSAVPIGSNRATPTLENNMKSEPEETTQQPEPPEGTQKSFNELLQTIKLY